MYVFREELEKNIGFPTGSAIAVIGADKERFYDLKKYKICDKIDVDTRFAFVCGDKDTGLNAYRLTNKKIPFCIVDARPENVFVNDVLWNADVPFVSKIARPDFMVKLNEDKKADIGFCARLIFAVAEKITVEILSCGYSDTVFPPKFVLSDFLQDGEGVLELADKVMGRVDGLKQFESALTLLKVKEKSDFNRNDTVVLLAKYLAKVYNYFIKYQPSSVFPPDNNGREEALTEFFGVQRPNVRKTLTEFEVRKRYYMIAQNSKILTSLWNDVCDILDALFLKHRMFTENNGFCIEQISDDAKFALFMAPDILDGETLLSFIKDCGVADNFI
ncbi:MAG: hypothetical protein J6C23_08690 [Clostridia bacterium]|nr:hypothetical protein [Clostridia bacterium]